jgi:hypothetical protein
MPILRGKNRLLLLLSFAFGACNSWGEFWNVAATSPPSEYLFVPGSFSRHTYRYAPATNTFTAGPDLTGNIGMGANAFNIHSGIHAGKILIIHAAATSLTSIYDPQNRSMIPGPDLGLNADIYSHNFLIPSGPQSGKTMIIPGLLASTRIYDPDTNAFSAGPALSNAGRITLAIPSGMHPGKFLIVAFNTTDLYDPATHSIVAGPTPASVIASNGTNLFPVRNGPHAGRFAFVRGGGNPLVTLYDPVSHTFPATLNLTSGSDDGGQSFHISTGPLAGSTMVVHSNSTSAATLYQESLDTVIAQDVGVTVNYTSNSFDLTAGPYSGKRLVAIGLSTDTRLFDYATGSFTAGPSVPEIVGAGSLFIALP